MKNKNGQALIVATILFILLVIVLGEAVLLYMRNHHRLNIKQIALTDDFYYAQGGIERAKYKLKINAGYAGETYTRNTTNTFIPADRPDLEIKISLVSSQGSQYVFRSEVVQIKSGGDFSVLRTIQATLQRIVNEDTGATTVNLVDWQEIYPSEE